MRTSVVSMTFLAAVASASYVIEDDYTPSAFASMFDFFTGADPTHGYVNYVDLPTAQSSGLYNANNGLVYMGVDSTNVATGSGRNSIRISSKKSYNHGLVILDLAHMPAGQCGTWPAFWLLGPNWPNSGEVDIIEGVNAGTTNAMTVHTNSGCSITNTGAFSGSMLTSNCDVNAPGQGTNEGCSIQTSNNQSYGAGFNAIGGGVYATQWTSDAISIWYFPRYAIPADISSGNPTPANWGLPMAQFTGACNIDDHIVNQQIVFDMTFCGDWAGTVWSTDATCSSQGSTCQSYVQNNPTAFQQTYWSINSLRVYQDNGVNASPASATTSTSSAALSQATSVFTASTPVSSPATTSISYPPLATTYSDPYPTVSPDSTTSTTTTETTFTTVTEGDPAATTSNEPTTTTTMHSTTSVFTTVFSTTTLGSGIATSAPAAAAASSSPAPVASPAATSSNSNSGWSWTNWSGNGNNNHSPAAGSSLSWRDWHVSRKRWSYKNKI